ncbi:uncharacterized protein DMENIID0001_032360 [Sergentomyia squamirostris]
MSKKMSISQPDWAEMDFFFKILNNYLTSKTSYKLMGYSVKKSESVGQNYASDMFFAKVEYKTESDNVEGRLLSIIVKVKPESEMRRIVLDKMYMREIIIYRDILPKIRTLLDDVGISTEIAPRCVLTQDSPTTLLALENLSQTTECYRSVDRRQGLDFYQTKSVLGKLATFHACTMVINERTPEIFEPFCDPTISHHPDQENFVIFFRVGVRGLLAEVSTWKGYEEMVKKLTKLETTIVDKGVNVYKWHQNPFNVLNHNDVWTNNLIFNFDELDGTLRDSLMLDYQLCNWGSPGIDLNFLLYGSIDDSVRRTKLNQLIEHYHFVMTDILKKLKFSRKMPTLQNIYSEVSRTGFHGVNAALCLRPMAMMPPRENAHMETFLSDGPEGVAFRKDVYSNPKYQQFIKPLLQEFDQKGYFD